MRTIVTVATTLAGILVLARRRLIVATVSGPSMLPTYQTGDRVLVRRCRPASLRRRQVVLVQDMDRERDDRTRARAVRRLDEQRWFIKRIAALPGDRVPEAVRAAVGGAHRVPAAQLVIVGDGTNSHDSRQAGFIPAERVLGVVIARLHTPREPTVPSEVRAAGSAGRPRAR